MFVDFLKDNWNLFNETDQAQIKREIQEHKMIYGKIGDPNLDEPKWLSILEWK